MQANSYLNADILQCSVARHYEGEHGASVVSVGFAPRWDIQFKDGKTMEVKVDSLAAQTYNAAVEYWDTRRNKATGILETEADLWLHCVPEGSGLRCYEIPRTKLLKLCIEAGQLRTGGDFDASCMKLIPLQEIKKISNTEFVLNGKLVDFIRS